MIPDEIMVCGDCGDTSSEFDPQCPTCGSHRRELFYRQEYGHELESQIDKHLEKIQRQKKEIQELKKELEEAKKKNEA